MNVIPSVLVVDDDIVAAELLSEVLTREGYAVKIATHGKDAVRLGEASAFDLVITDLKMPGMTGLEVLKAFKRMAPSTATIVITAFGSFDTAIEAIRSGAYDYIIKPFKIEEIKLKIQRCFEQKALLSRKTPASIPAWPARAEESFSFKTIIGAGPKMMEIYKIVARVAPGGVPVLIQGESGTGKELIARAIHDTSPRAKERYLTVNCANLPENLLESELFGYTRGAFTGAINDKRGLLEEATGGTCFLDEIGDLPLALQAKLLRVLQTNEIRRLGGSEDLSVDIRFVAATNKDLAAMVRAGQFREDLFYRLHVVSLTLPPLREHPEDIPLLAEYFLSRAVMKTKKEAHAISKEAMAVLSSYEWPGNIRELENVIERAIALTSNRVLMPSDIPDELSRGETDDRRRQDGLLTLEEVKTNYIEEVLKHTGGNQIMAASILGIDRKTLYRMLKKKG